MTGPGPALSDLVDSPGEIGQVFVHHAFVAGVQVHMDAGRFDLAADQPFYTAQLPVINASLSELMVLGDTWMGKLGALVCQYV